MIFKTGDVRVCDTFKGGIDERFVCRLTCEQALPGVRGAERKRGRSDW